MVEESVLASLRYLYSRLFIKRIFHHQTSRTCSCFAESLVEELVETLLALRASPDCSTHVGNHLFHMRIVW